MDGGRILVNLLLILIGIALALGTLRFAWWLSASAFPLDQRFPDRVERSLPLQGRWLRVAARTVVFPFVLFMCGIGAALLFYVIASFVERIGLLLSQ